MRNKRTLFLFCALLFMVTLVVLSSVLFAVSDVSVTPHSTAYALESQRVEENISSLIGTSILVLSERKLSREVEREFAYCRVLSVEREFPSRVILHVSERYELFAVTSGGESFAHLDRDGKVLRLSESKASVKQAGSVYDNIEVLLPEQGLIRAEAGETAELSQGAAFGLLTAMLRSSPGFDEFGLRQYISKIDLTVSGRAVITTRSGAKFNLVSYEQDAEGCISAMNRAYAELMNDSQRAFAVATVFKGENDGVSGIFVDF